MGRSYWGLGEIEMAERHLTQAYDLYRQHAGEDDYDALGTASHLARLYSFQSDFSKAEPLALRVLDGRRRLLGDSHPESLLAMYHLAVHYHFKDEPERAEPLFAEALQASLPRGDRDLTRLRIMGGFGHLYVTLGRYDEAERLFDKALKGSQNVVGDKSPYNLIGKSILATLYLKTGRLAEAEQQASEAYRGWRIVSERNPHTLWSQGILAWVYLAQGRRSDAEPLLREFREKADRQQDRPLPDVIKTIGDLGYALLHERDFPQAESFLRFYVAVAAKKLPDGWRRSAAVSALGACLLGQKKNAEAEPLLLKGYAGLRQYEARIPASFRRLRLTEALERLVQLYVELGKPDEAAKWRKELEAAKGDAKPAAGSGEVRVRDAALWDDKAKQVR
jgi:non-specific serine/threonine protein kinase/serine/threonine-protein kinase